MGITEYDDIHGNLGFLMGYPVYESSLAKEPLVLRPSNGQVAIVVPNYREFENEIWIETSLHAAVRKNMGDTLEWVYGPQARKWWVGSKSRYSQMMLRLQMERLKDETTKRAAKMAEKMRGEFVAAVRQEYRVAGGVSTPWLGSGFTQDAATRSIITGSVN